MPLRDNLIIFESSLKNKQKRLETFDKFLNRYKQTFDKVISLKYGDDKYEGVDIASIFYDNLIDFVEKEAKNDHGCTDIPTWVNRIGRIRADNIINEVNREAVRILTNKGGVENWDKAYTIMESAYDDVIKKVVYSKFKGMNKHYAAIYRSVSTYFYEGRKKSGANKPKKEIKNYKAWLTTCLRHKADEKREKIYEELGIDHADLPENLKDEQDPNEDFEVDNYKVDQNEDFSESDNGKEDNMSDTAMYDEENQQEENDVNNDEETDNEEIKATQKDTVVLTTDNYFNELEHYINMMPEKTEDDIRYKDFLKDDLLDERDNEWLIDKYEIPSGIYNLRRRAKSQLFKVALPDKRRQFKSLAIKYVNFIADKKERQIIQQFFIDGKSYEEIAKTEKTTPSNIGNKVVVALHNLVKRAKDDPWEYANDEDIEIYEDSTREATNLHHN